MKIYAITKKGLCKSENEDRILVNKQVLGTGSLEIDVQTGIFAIADGVGGNEGGAVASEYLVNTLGNLHNITKESFLLLNDQLIAEGNTLKYSQMASTLAGISFNESNTTLFSVGNSRVYSIQNGKYLKQLTVDDSLVQQLISRGQLKESEIKNFDRKNEITACFGGGNKLLCKINVENISKTPAIFMITSDGIHDYLTTDELEDLILANELGLALCEKILFSAIEHGSQDDLSILIGVK